MLVFFNRQHNYCAWWPYFRQTIGIPMATICALLVDVFQYLFEVNFIQGLLQRSEQNSFLLHMDDVILLNNARFGDFLNPVYLNELDIKNTRHSKIIFTHGFVLEHLQRGPLIKHIVRQKRRFHLFNCQTFQHSSSNFTQKLYISNNTILHGLCIISVFL